MKKDIIRTQSGLHAQAIIGYCVKEGVKVNHKEATLSPGHVIMIESGFETKLDKVTAFSDGFLAAIRALTCVEGK